MVQKYQQTDTEVDQWYPYAEPFIECQFCGGPLEPLGALGTRMYYRCRNCGVDCSANIN